MIKYSLLTLGVAVAVSAPAFASTFQASQTVEVATVSIDETGEEIKTFIEAVEISPGDEVRYRLTYDNQTDNDVVDVNLVMPVPVEITFIEGSAMTDGVSVSYSADEGASFSRRSDVSVLVGDAERIATSDEITHIKWTFTEAIATGETGEISFRGILQ